MIKIPYGQSNFEGMIKSGFFYQDRTMFIEKLEQWPSRFPVFLRPRRFGKSLFVSTLHYYYGLEYKADFQTLFGQLYIGQHPTNSANNYLVLSFEFSRIDTTTHERTYEGFLFNVLSGARRFLSVYDQYFSEEDARTVLSHTRPEAVITAIFDVAKKNGVAHKIFILIDEYDHFANELLSFDINRFKKGVSRNGFVRKFYEGLKTASRDGVVERIFITGVSPVTLDSLTSGFNISDHLSQNPVFHDMMGFTAGEVEQILHQSDIPATTIPHMMEDLKAWYDGYMFTPDATASLFNPDMVLYFLKEYSIAGKYPYLMLDINVISDYRKVRNIFRIGDGEMDKFELLQHLVEDGYIDFPLTILFNFESAFSHDDFLSLLFYMGMLTFKEFSDTGWRCKIPNYVIKKLYFEYFTAVYLDRTKFAKSRRPIMAAVSALLSEGNPEPFFKLTEYVLTEIHSNRDEMHYGEKHLQTLMVGLLFPYESYYIHSEYEARKGYPDIFLERMPNRPLKYDVVLELKYVKKSKEDTLPGVIAEAEAQLDHYMNSERFSRPDVRGFYVVFLGGKVYQWREWVTNSAVST